MDRFYIAIPPLSTLPCNRDQRRQLPLGPGNFDEVAVHRTNNPRYRSVLPPISILRQDLALRPVANANRHAAPRSPVALPSISTLGLDLNRPLRITIASIHVEDDIRLSRPQSIPLAAWEAKYLAHEEAGEIVREMQERMGMYKVLDNTKYDFYRPESGCLGRPISRRSATSIGISPLVHTTGQIQIMLEASRQNVVWLRLPTGDFVRPNPAEIIQTFRDEVHNAAEELREATQANFGDEPFRIWDSANSWQKKLLKDLEDRDWSLYTEITEDILEWLKDIGHKTHEHKITISRFLEDLEKERWRKRREGATYVWNRAPGALERGGSGGSSGKNDNYYNSSASISTGRSAMSRIPSGANKPTLPKPWMVTTAASSGEGVPEDPTNSKKRRREDLPNIDLPTRRDTYPLAEGDERMAQRTRINREEHSSTV